MQETKRIMSFTLSVLCIVSFIFTSAVFATDEFAAGKNEIVLELNGVAAAYDLRSVSLLPGEMLSIQTSIDETPVDLKVSAVGGELEPLSEGSWQWTAPDQPGLYPIILENRDTRESILVNAFVLHPYAKLKKGYLNGYHIGNYPNNGLYERPRGFIEVTQDNQDMFVSPHFRLKQFLCKQSSHFPKYLMLSEKLLMKLEMILEKLNVDEFRADTLTIMSGFRTPAYNRSLGNVRFSRHLWGDATDILVMKDLNGDGKIDFKDSLILKEIVEDLENEFPNEFSMGGIGVYKHTGLHGPFVHVDARGFPARWVNSPKRRRRHVRAKPQQVAKKGATS